MACLLSWLTDPITALGDFVVILHGHPFGAVVLVALAWVALAWIRNDKSDGK